MTKQPPIAAAVDAVIAEMSPFVKRIRYDLGDDWTGQLAIFFRVVLSDEARKS